MKIKKLVLKNIKSFKDETVVDFDDSINILIGPNAGGKSNLLSVLSIIMNHYFFEQYQFQFKNNAEQRTIEDVQKKSIFGNINLELDKYFEDDSDSIITIVLETDTSDYENMRSISLHKEEIEKRLNRYSSNKSIDSPENWEDQFVEKKELTYRIVNCNLDRADPGSPEALFLYYLRKYHSYIWYTDEIDSVNLSVPMIFFPPSRVLSNQFKIDHSSLKPTDFYNNISSLMAIHSRATNVSLSQIAVLYFGKKHKEYTWKAANTKDDRTVSDLFYKDNEVVLFTKYLRMIGYEWDLIEDKPLSQYKFILKKDDKEFDINKASSGEQEILNFLLGIFSLNVIGGVVFIDEPEIHLHPKWQNLLIEVIMDLSRKRNNQFILSTHSPSFITEKTYGYIIRVYKYDKSSKVVVLKNVKPFPLKDVLHIINGTNNEKIFFSDIVILVEGITDRLVFTKILNDLLKNKETTQVYEVIDIRGKSNQEKFNKFLENLDIPVYFIADLDYLNECGDSNIRRLLRTNKKRIVSDVIMNNKSRDGIGLIEAIENSIKNRDFSALVEIFNYIKSSRIKLKKDITADEQLILERFINKMRGKGVYILQKGDIEDYFPNGYRTKELVKVLDLLNDSNFEKWKNDEQASYTELESIVTSIVEDQH